MYSQFEANEVPLAEFLKTDSEAELEEDVILRRGAKREGKWDLELARDVWESVRSCEYSASCEALTAVMTPEMWVTY